MNLFDFDFDRFTKALHIQGFDFVLLLDSSGTILAERSSSEFEQEIVSEHVTSIIQLANSFSEQINGGLLQAASFEFASLKLLIGATPTFTLCGIPAKGTPQMYACNEIQHALRALL